MIKKNELEELFKKLEIPFNEGIQYMNDNNAPKRIVFFESVWEPLTASGNEYDTNVTYQVSFFSDIPRDEKLLKLKGLLALKKIYPVIYHEYLEAKRTWHSYFNVEVLENLNLDNLNE